MDAADSTSCIRLDVDADGVAVVTIDRPEKRNALSFPMWQRLAEIFTKLDEDPEVRVVVLTGGGEHFCSGADISEFETVRYDSVSAAQYDAENDRAAIAIRDCRKPVIAALRGAAVGGGLGIALACDFRVADETIRTGIPAARLGILYSVFDTTLLQSRVGTTNAKLILLSGQLFNLSDAKHLGIVNRVADSGQTALEAAKAWAGEFLTAAPLSISGHKIILSAIDSGMLEERRERIEALISEAFDSDDYREGRKAFLERRPPVFSGR